MSQKDYHKVLGLSQGASEKQIKTAYRKLALKYHPDRNTAPGAKNKFHEITLAYNYLLEHPFRKEDRASSYEDRMASEVLRRERERMQAQARARREKKKREEEYFDRPEWHDPLLLLKYGLRGFALLFASVAIIFPILLAIFGDPASLAGTSFFIIIGVFLMVYIYQKRSTWFRLGKFNSTLIDVKGFFSMKSGKKSKDRCCYCRNAMANGQSYRIELIKTLDIKITSYGPLNHGAKYKNKVKSVVIPRSIRVQFFHRMSTLLKLASIILCLILFPVESLIWRFIAGMLTGGILSMIMQTIAGVRSRIGYLLTPSLAIKGGIWLLALFKISIVGPGFNLETTGSVYIVVAGLLFLLDMLFDLFLGLFPFYPRLFRPIFKQSTVLDSLYKDEYRNYQELPVYSMAFPLFKWIF